MESLWEFLKYLALGLIQGFTEPLPVSSSGHMVILNSIFGDMLPSSAMNNFQIIVNTASLIAIMFYYRNLLKDIIAGSWNYLFRSQKEQKNNFVYLMLIVLATIPAGIVGVIIKKYELDSYFTNLLCVGITLFITGNLLLFIHHAAENSNRENITWKDSLLMGAAQVIGLLPGISRSGVTTSFGVANKVSMGAALRFSFMMYIPASLGATVLGIYDLMGSDESITQTGSILGYIGAFVVSLIATYFSIKLFFRLVKNKNLRYFGYYCIGISVIIIILMATGVLAWK